MNQAGLQNNDGGVILTIQFTPQTSLKHSSSVYDLRTQLVEQWNAPPSLLVTSLF